MSKTVAVECVLVEGRVGYRKLQCHYKPSHQPSKILYQEHAVICSSQKEVTLQERYPTEY